MLRRTCCQSHIVCSLTDAVRSVPHDRPYRYSRQRFVRPARAKGDAQRINCAGGANHLAYSVQLSIQGEHIGAATACPVLTDCFWRRNGTTRHPCLHAISQITSPGHPTHPSPRSALHSPFPSTTFSPTDPIVIPILPPNPLALCLSSIVFP